MANTEKRGRSGRGEHTSPAATVAYDSLGVCSWLAGTIMGINSWLAGELHPSTLLGRHTPGRPEISAGGRPPAPDSPSLTASNSCTQIRLYAISHGADAAPHVALLPQFCRWQPGGSGVSLSSTDNRWHYTGRVPPRSQAPPAVILLL
jgi:hypothetical protein